MRYALHESDSRDGTLFDLAPFAQRLVPLGGARDAASSDEVLYVLDGEGRATVGDTSYELGPGMALFVAQGNAWSAEGDGKAVSVLVHDPAPATAQHAALDLAEVEQGHATSGRQFVLGATPDVGCASVTQFIGLVPPGRAPDHFHTYDEVIYIVEGTGVLYVDAEEAELRAGSCVHLPARLVHCLANTGEQELRLLGVFRPAGSPAEAYYPDGAPAVVGEEQ